MKVLLVGNGCSALEHKLGKVIDTEFDLVLRMNRFKTEGYEEYVGSKTNVWLVTDNMFQYVINKTDGIEGSQNWENYDCICVGIPTFKYNQFNQEQTKNLKVPVVIFPPQIGDVVSNNLNLPPDRWPTLGMQSLYAGLYDEKVKEIYLYGFDGKDKKYEYLHYYDDEKTPNLKTESYYSRKITHSDKVEFEHIQELVKSKKIKMLHKHYKGEEE